MLSNCDQIAGHSEITRLIALNSTALRTPHIRRVSQGSGVYSLVTWWPRGNASAPGTFLPAVTYRTGQQPIFVAVADLNGDGKPDIAVADQGLPTTTTGVHVLLQDPSLPGTFQAPTDYVTGSGSTELAIAEIDGDGTPDIAAASGANLSVLFGSITSPGIFPTIDNYPGNPVQTGLGTIPPMVLWVAIGDLNGDGKPDLVFADDTGVSIRFQDPANPGKFLSSTTVVSSP